MKARRESEGVNSDGEVCALNELIVKGNILTETYKGKKEPLWVTCRNRNQIQNSEVSESDGQ